jgi:putative restriction endonuclease
MPLYTPHPLYLDVTDPTWFSFHKGRGALEVNFWRPSATPFRALQPGQNILFKLKAPHNAVAGGGTFVRYTQMRLSEAWRMYGEMNGFESLAEMRRKLAKPDDPDPLIGCKILEGCHFYDPADWRPCPSSFGSAIVSGKTYHEGDLDGQALNAEFEERRSAYLTHRALTLPSTDLTHSALTAWDAYRQEYLTDPKRYGESYLTRPRLGQGAFRAMVLDAYKGQCAITGEHTAPVLQAAHIKPYADQGEHSLKNALLLRSDFHTLFDQGYVTVTPDYRLEVSKQIRHHYNNGKLYEARQGKPILVPDLAPLRPDVELLRWHNEAVFLG